MSARNRAPGAHQGIQTPKIPRPVGGGALGHGEHFHFDAAMGNARFEVPIEVPSARGLAPVLTLRYASGASNGLFGNGFSLELPAISRRTSIGIPRYDGRDQFVTETGDVLVARHDDTSRTGGDGPPRAGKTITHYVRRFERDFDRIRHVVDTRDGTSSWEVTDRNGVLWVYGRSAAARIADPAHPDRIFRWMIEEARDSRGNRVLYDYESDGEPDAASLYPRSIRYGNFGDLSAEPPSFAFEVRFRYDDPADAPRPDPVLSFRAGFAVKIARLCRRVEISHHFPDHLGEQPLVTGRVSFDYDASDGITLLAAVRREGFRRDRAGTVHAASLPPISLTYTPWSPKDARFQPLDPSDWPPIPGPVDNGRLGFVDLYGDGIPGLLQQARDGTAAYFWRPNGAGTFASPQPLPTAPVDGLGYSHRTALLDLTGLGRLDEVLLTPGRAGCYPNNPGSDWAPFAAFQSTPTELDSPTGQFADLAGTGRPDFIDACVSTWRVSESLGRDGYAPARTVQTPRGIERYSSDNEGTFIGFVDVFGDGLSHLVCVTSGSTRVWPSLGYGLFGEPREIAGSPVFPSSVSRHDILFGPFTGTGGSDLAIVLDDRVDIYQNLGGDRFVPLGAIPLPSNFSRLGALVAADVLGRGTSQLVVSSILETPSHAILDLTSGSHPFLLSGIDNGMGSVSSITYHSSVDYALADRAAGRPWATTLPFPVQVVAEIRQTDLISRTTETRTAQYADGFFDPIDRQFAGFAYVQVQNSRTSDGSLWHFPSATENDVASTGALLTKTWYHVGDLAKSAELRDAMLRDAFKAGPDDLLLPGPHLSSAILNAGGDTMAIAVKALAGRKVREETFAVDRHGVLAHTPFRVDQAAQGVSLVQAADAGSVAVVLPVERETSQTLYEGIEDDPRVGHELNVMFDEFGQALRTLTVGYHREKTEDRLPDQAETKMMLATTGVINKHDGRYRNANGGTTVPISTSFAGDAHCMGPVFERQSFELLGGTAPSSYLTYDEAAAAAEEGLRNVKPFGVRETNEPAAHLFEWSRSLFWGEGGSAPAPLQECGAELLPYRDLQAVYSDAFVTRYLGDVATPEALQVAGFHHDEAYWWRPDDAVAYQGADRCFLPKSVTNALDATTTMTFDAYGLHVIETVDALGHKVSAAIDYQALLPSEITDENEVCTSYLYDPLAQLVADSIAGREDGAPVGDGSLDEYVPVPDATASAVWHDPDAFLQRAGSFYFYDLGAWHRHPPSPPSTIAVKRRHFVDPEPGVVARADVAMVVQYFDGSLRKLATASLVDAAAADAAWLVTDQVRYNDRGDAISRYRPYFAGTPEFTSEPTAPTWTFEYDGLGREIASSTPGGFLTQTVYAAWSTTHWDEDDLVTQSPTYKANIDNPACPAAEKDALRMAAEFEDTWIATVVDVLGRTIQTVQDLVPDEAGRKALRTYAWLDARGQTVAFTNPRFYNDADPREPACYDFSTIHDMVGLVAWSASANAGDLPIRKLDEGRPEIWLHDATGQPILLLDQRGFSHTFGYNALRQPTETSIAGHGIDALVETLQYGVDAASNSVNRLVEQRDQAGVERIEAYSILGAPRHHTRQYRRSVEGLPDWRGDVPLLQTVWSSRETHGAVGQVLTYTAPDGAQVAYDHTANDWPKALRLTRPAATAPIPICQVESFSPDGLTGRLSLGNGVVETRSYDRDTGRLRQIKATTPDGGIVQDLSFTFDPVGNVTQEVDAVAWPTDADRAAAASDYRYDSLYRLRSATGRRDASGDAAAIEPYARTYHFDHGDNLRLVVDAAGPERSTQYEIASTSDHAVTAAMASQKPLADWYDAAGSMLGLPNGTGLVHDPLGRLATATGPGGTLGRFQYARGGIRQRKLVLPANAAAGAVETFYVGPFIATLPPETPDGATAEPVASLQIALGARGLAMATNVGAQTSLSYELVDQIDSIRVRLDASGAVTGREEFYPFGGTALSHDSTTTDDDRFRFGGKERDPDTALYSFPMRYYCPEMARWISPDPAGLIDGPNRFAYVDGNPLTLVDPTGLWPDWPDWLLKYGLKLSDQWKYKKDPIPEQLILRHLKKNKQIAKTLFKFSFFGLTSPLVIAGYVTISIGARIANYSWKAQRGITLNTAIWNWTGERLGNFFRSKASQKATASQQNLTNQSINNRIQVNIIQGEKGKYMTLYYAPSPHSAANSLPLARLRAMHPASSTNNKPASQK